MSRRNATLGAASFAGRYVDPFGKSITIERAGASSVSVTLGGNGRSKPAQQLVAAVHGGTLSLWNLTGQLSAAGGIAWNNMIAWTRSDGNATSSVSGRQHAHAHQQEPPHPNPPRPQHQERPHVQSSGVAAKQCVPDQSQARAIASGGLVLRPRRPRIGVLVVGLLRALGADERNRTAQFLDGLGPRSAVRVFGVFQQLRVGASNCSAPLQHVHELLSAGGERVAEERLVTDEDKLEAEAGCRNWNSCPGYMLQFHKVWLAWRMLERDEARDGGARVDVVLRLRLDLRYTLEPVQLEAMLALAAWVSAPSVQMQHDYAWLASRSLAGAIAGAWMRMKQRAILQQRNGTRALLAVMPHLAWLRISKSCWAFHSNFLRCMPYPVDWLDGWSRARVRQMAANGTAAVTMLQAAINSSARWRASDVCPWVITTRTTANELAWISEPELALGLALFERGRIDAASEGPLPGTCEDCATFGDLYSKGNPNNAEC